MTEAALPHSGIPGSKQARCSPGHIAVRRALHRLLAPRHPPVALGSLIISRSSAEEERAFHIRRALSLPTGTLTEVNLPAYEDALYYHHNSPPYGASCI
jgi:hypothetical protein